MGSALVCFIIMVYMQLNTCTSLSFLFFGTFNLFNVNKILEPNIMVVEVIWVQAHYFFAEAPGFVILNC